MAAALFSPSLFPEKGLRGKEQIFDNKCHSTSLQIPQVLTPCCWAVMCGVVCPCLDPGLLLSLGHGEFCHVPTALNTSGLSIWYRELVAFEKRGIKTSSAGEHFLLENILAEFHVVFVSLWLEKGR